LDRGPIVGQLRVDYSDFETGGALHARVMEAEKDLFGCWWPRILAGEDLPCDEQPSGGSYHSRRQFFELKSLPPPAADLTRLARALEFKGPVSIQQSA
jgi:hypothetical protein